MTRHPAAASLPERVEVVLLDAGGVLLDLDYGYLRRLIETRHAAAVGLDELATADGRARVEIERLVSRGGRVGESWRDYWRLVLAGVHVPAALHEGLIDALWEAHQRVGLWTAAVERGPQVVGELRRRGYRLGVVSNAEGQVARDLDAAGYSGLFETVVDSFHAGVEKPDPAIFQLALERLRGAAATSVFVGDLPAVDVEGARRAGIAPLLLDRHGLYPEAGVPRLAAISELLDLLAGPS